jgi:hypothetical protein
VRDVRGSRRWRRGAQIDRVGDRAGPEQQSFDRRLRQTREQSRGSVLAWNDGALGAAFDAADDRVDDGVELDGLEAPVKSLTSSAAAGLDSASPIIGVRKMTG